jgi:type IV pilus assembly protein PilQ
MNFLQNTIDLCKKVIFTLVVFSCFASAAAAQTVPAQQQGKMYGDPGFIGEPINLNVVNADIRDILNYITEQYGVNFVIDKSVGAIPVTVNVSDVPWNIALDSILQSQELAVQVNGPILRIASKKTIAAEEEINAKIRSSQLDSSPLYTEFIRLNYARAAGTLGGEAGASGGFSGGVVSGGGGGGGSTGSADQGILGIIKRRLSRRGSVEVDGRSNTLIITDVRENIDAIRQLVILLDQPEPQVEIETRIVVAQRNFLRDLGVSLGVSVNNPFGRGGVLSGNTNNNTISENGLFTLTTGAFGTAQINATLNLGEQKGQLKTIATPRVTALNNRPAQIESGSQIPVTTVQRDEGNDSVPVVTTTFVNVPLRLSVTPQISDAGVVILRVVAENNTVNTALSSNLTGTPGIDTQRMQTEVLVPDGGTTVVGGVVVDSESETRGSTPGLASIPLLKYLFKNKSTRRDTAEILFFITPRIYRSDYNGNPTSGKVSDGNRTTTIIQPVPLGNPPSNSEIPGQTPQQPQLPLVPVTPVAPTASPVPTSNNETRP